MKKAILLSLGILMSLCTTFAQLYWTRGAQEDTVYGVLKTGTTYRLFNSVYIPVGKSLTIQPGVTVLICDTGTVTARNPSGNQLEIDALGDFYSLGTKAQPVIVKVADSLINNNSFGQSFGPYGQYWGSIFCDTSCHELVMTYTDMSNTGYVTTNTSFSVQLGLFKASAGETTPEICFRGGMGVNGGAAPHGKLVVENNTFHNTSDDCIYVQGGNFIIANNLVYTEGQTGGDCFDVKSGSWGDECFNIIYSPNTNGVKCANTLGYNPTVDVVAYNNTILNAGWRRTSIKGGSMWLESGAIAHLYNNLIVDCRFGLKNSVETNGGADTSSRWDYNYYFGHSQTCVDQFQPYNAITSTGTPDVVSGPHDVRGTLKGQNDPLFVNYPVTGADSSATGGYLNSTYDTNWDFHLQPNSPAIGKGTSTVNGHFNVNGLVFTEGINQTFISPMASTTIGAKGPYISDTAIVVTPSTKSLKVDSTFTLMATIEPFDADSTTYTWKSADTLIAKVNTSGVVTGIGVGTVSIYAITTDRSLKDSCEVTVSLSPATAVPTVHGSNSGLKVYPNPTSSVLNLQFNANADQTIISIYSTDGKILMSNTVSTEIGIVTLPFNVESLAKGLYFISVQNGGQNQTSTFIKQ